MSLKRQGVVANVDPSTTLTLKAEANESFLVRSIRTWNDTGQAAEDIKVTIDQNQIQQFKAPASWALLEDVPILGETALIHQLMELGLFPTYPVASGQTLEVSGLGANSFLEVMYDIFDRDDIRADMKNGSDTLHRRFFQILGNSATVTQAGQVALDQTSLDSIYADVPGKDAIPARQRWELLALFGAPAQRGTAAFSSQFTTKLSLIRNQVHLLDQDRGGITFRSPGTTILVAPDYANEAGALNVNGFGGPQPHGLIVFDPHIDFNPGDNVQFEATVVENAAAGDFTANQILIGCIFDIIPL